MEGKATIPTHKMALWCEGSGFFLSTGNDYAYRTFDSYI